LNLGGSACGRWVAKEFRELRRDRRTVYPDLAVRENLDFTAQAYGLSGSEHDRQAAEIVERIGLTAARHRLGSQLSGGMQRKLAVGLALLHSPDLLVLDELTTGVDPVSRAGLWRLSPPPPQAEPPSRSPPPT